MFDVDSYHLSRGVGIFEGPEWCEPREIDFDSLVRRVERRPRRPQTGGTGYQMQEQPMLQMLSPEPTA